MAFLFYYFTAVMENWPDDASRSGFIAEE